MIALFAAVLALQAAGQEPESTLQKLEAEVAAIVDKVRPSVVQVIARFRVEASAPADTLTFSGLVFSKDGHIVTDASGLAAAGEVSVAVGTRTYTARLVASDRQTGVAVLKIAAEGLTPAVFADAPCKPGATAVAVGNALGLKGTSSVGTVLGLGRSIVVGGRQYDDMIQLTAPLHPGDCGGGVADARGRVVGIIHSAYTGDAGEGKGTGLLHLFGKNARDRAPAAQAPVGFATPADRVTFAAERIIRHGRMVRGWVGISARPVEEAARAQLGIPEGQGVEVVGVDEKGPAAAAGIKTHDVLLEIDGQPVKDLPALQWTIARMEPPGRVRLAVLRDKVRQEIGVDVVLDPQK